MYGDGRSNKLFIAIVAEYGYDALKEFLVRSSKVAYAYCTLFGVTIGVKEYMLTEQLKKEKESLLTETEAKVQQLIEQYKSKKLEPLLGMTLKQSLEQTIVVELDLARGSAINMLSKSIDNTNFAMLMANSGARASILNVEQMSMFLGQQASREGGRIRRGYYTNRVLPHIPRNKTDAEARGFVKSSFLEGLTPIEMLMHAVGGRGTVIQKGLLTQRSGYLQRRLANALQDYYVLHDNSVRDVNNNLIETIYGGDALDPTKVEFARQQKK